MNNHGDSTISNYISSGYFFPYCYLPSLILSLVAPNTNRILPGYQGQAKNKAKAHTLSVKQLLFNFGEVL